MARQFGNSNSVCEHFVSVFVIVYFVEHLSAYEHYDWLTRRIDDAVLEGINHKVETI
jgi:hypothetical protein